MTNIAGISMADATDRANVAIAKVNDTINNAVAVAIATIGDTRIERTHGAQAHLIGSDEALRRACSAALDNPRECAAAFHRARYLVGQITRDDVYPPYPAAVVDAARSVRMEIDTAFTEIRAARKAARKSLQ